MGIHTVEKIGGTSMSLFPQLLDTILIGDRTGKELYNRIFVVSAYGGITNLLLEHKKTGAAGVYKLFADNNPKWQDALEDVQAEMIKINISLADCGLDQKISRQFIEERISGAYNVLVDLQRLCSYGHFQLEDYLPVVREILSSLGEAHSAFNSVEILKQRGINAHFADLTGWKDRCSHPFEEKIQLSFQDIDYSNTLTIATGYAKCTEGLMKSYDRGYSEITFSKIATVTGAKEGIIHKEFHLCSADPNLIGLDKVEIIGQTNFDVADQLSDLGMEAIHPKASKDMERNNIPIRVMNAFEPNHPGTLISKEFKSDKPRVEIVTGRTDIFAIEIVDPDMVGESGYDYRICKQLADYDISYICKNTNANTITHYVPKNNAKLNSCIEALKDEFKGAEIRTTPVAIVSAIGSNIAFPGFLASAAGFLAEAGINILAIDQCMRQVNMQFIISVQDFEKAVKALHAAVVEA